MHLLKYTKCTLSCEFTCEIINSKIFCWKHMPHQNTFQLNKMEMLANWVGRIGWVLKTINQMQLKRTARTTNDII